MTNRSLTYRQQRFVEEMVIDPTNATAAAKRAGYSPNCATEQAYELLNKPHIKEQIEEINETAAKRLGITKERILNELAQIGFANLKHIVTQDAEGNTSVNLSYLPEHLTSPITEISVQHKKGKRDVRVKVADKQAALINLAKMMGWFKDELKVSGQLSLEQLIEQSMQTKPEPPTEATSAS